MAIERRPAGGDGRSYAGMVHALKRAWAVMDETGQRCEGCGAPRPPMLTKRNGRWTAMCRACSRGTRSASHPSVAASRRRLLQVTGGR